MRWGLVILGVCVLAFESTGAIGCDSPKAHKSEPSENPCEWFAQKFERCAQEARPKNWKEDSAAKKKFIEECKTSKRLKQKAWVCAGEGSCDKIMECFFSE